MNPAHPRSEAEKLADPIPQAAAESELPSLPVAKITMKDGEIQMAATYMPGLPDGDHDLFAGHDDIAQGIIDDLRSQIVRLTEDGERWKSVVWAVARELNCLPSTFSDGNAHVLKAAIKLNADLDALRAAAGDARAAGSLMANTMFNLAQQTHKFSDYHCKLFKLMQVKWDAAMAPAADGEKQG